MDVAILLSILVILSGKTWNVFYMKDVQKESQIIN